MEKSKSNRIIATPSSYAKNHYLYVQEVGSLQSLEPHISKRKNLSSYLFFVVTKGQGHLFYQGQRHSLHAGDCIFIDCLQEYAHESSRQEPWELSWVHFYGKDAPLFYQNYAEQGNSFVFHPSGLSLFLECLDFLYVAQNKQTAHTELICHRYLTDLITLCFQEGTLSFETSGHSTRTKILLIKEYIDEHFAEKISLDSLAELFFISKFHLAREFKRITGVTIGSYLLGRRLSKAKHLLRFSDEALDIITVSCGLSDPGYFIKVFKKAENLTPNQYRKKW